jgi:hypothetical protein
MQRIVGGALVAIGMIRVLVGIALLRAAARALRAARHPAHVLDRGHASIHGVHHPSLDVSGILVNEPTLQTPFTAQPCSCWNLLLRVLAYSGKRSYWKELWTQWRTGDMEIA